MKNFGLFIVFFLFGLPYCLAQKPGIVEVNTITWEWYQEVKNSKGLDEGIYMDEENNKFTVHNNIDEAINFLITADYDVLSSQTINTERVFIATKTLEITYCHFHWDDESNTYLINGYKSSTLLEKQ